jgi:N utilization substance protein A
MLVALGDKKILTLDDVGDLAADELIEAVAAVSKLSQDEANAIVMAARAHWFADEAGAPSDAAGRDGGAPAAPAGA